jgi:large subunit ribosomal protein L4
MDNQKVLLVIPGANKNIYLSSRNLQKNKVVTATELNTYDLLNAQKLVLVEGSVAVIENTLLK